MTLPLSLGREPAVGGRLSANRLAYTLSGVAALPRNGWLACVGFTGWLASESPAAFRRNTHVGIFPSEQSIIRLIGAVLLEANDEWHV
jgi:hypothetical protein